MNITDNELEVIFRKNEVFDTSRNLKIFADEINDLYYLYVQEQAETAALTVCGVQGSPRRQATDQREIFEEKINPYFIFRNVCSQY